jgi:hypothetical protein
MYKIRITNLANFAREIQFFQINKFVVLAPKKSVDVNCAGGAALSYYQNLQKKQFKISIINSNVPDETPAEIKNFLKQVVKPAPVEVEEPVVEEPEVKVEPKTAPAEPEVVEAEPEVTMDDLTDRQLKDILIKLGVSTSARARWKLVDLVNLNLPEDAKLSDYLS